MQGSSGSGKPYTPLMPGSIPGWPSPPPPGGVAVGLTPQNVTSGIAPRQIRQATLGFNTTNLQPGVPTKIAAIVQRFFRGERLIIPDEFSDATVHALHVGAENQLTPGADIPAGVLGPTALGIKLALKTAAVAQEISITVSRPGGGKFSAALIGTMAEGGDFEPEPVEPLVEEAQKAVKEMEEAYEPGVSLDEETGELVVDD